MSELFPPLHAEFETVAQPELTGYLHPDYALSFAEFATPLKLPTCGGWLLKRTVNGDVGDDAMGCYPLFCCKSWHMLQKDIEALRSQLISIVIVADPFGDHTEQSLKTCFDFAVPFKDHYVIETGQPLDEFVNKSHRRHALRALREVRVEICPKPLDYLEEWDRLYNVLAARHSITGLRRFSRSAFEKQLAIPGAILFRAVADHQTVGLDWWYTQGDCAQGHLAAYSPLGYELRASYATKWRMIEYFNDKVKWINLGAAATGDSSNGLRDFKRGWSTGTKRAWLCGSVLQAAKYAELVQACSVSGAGYFPAYRMAEFA